MVFLFSSFGFTFRGMFSGSGGGMYMGTQRHSIVIDQTLFFFSIFCVLSSNVLFWTTKMLNV